MENRLSWENDVCCCGKQIEEEGTARGGASGLFVLSRIRGVIFGM
jgi:hypothetical protein